MNTFLMFAFGFLAIFCFVLAVKESNAFVRAFSAMGAMFCGVVFLFSAAIGFQESGPALSRELQAAAASARNAGNRDSGTEEERLARMLQIDLRKNFGMPGYAASWHSSIVGVSIEGDRVTVRTNRQSEDGVASSICSGVSYFLYANDSPYASRLNDIEVTNATDTRTFIVRRRALGNGC